MFALLNRIEDRFGCELPLWLHHAAQGVKSFRYWFLYRLHPKHRYHVVRTGLKPGYYDEDTRMLHACMTCLEGYIEKCGGPEELANWIAELRQETEKEKYPGEHEANCRQAAIHEEALTIYHWWTTERPQDQRVRDELKSEWVDSGYDQERRDKLHWLEKKIADDEQGMLHCLIDIRGSLWT